MADCTIWVVDDDQDDIFLVEQAFKECSFDVRTFTGENIPKVLNTLLTLKDENLPQLVLLDINMPPVSGKDILQDIRKQNRFKHLPIAIFTTSNSKSERNQCLEYGANCFISKPNEFKAMVKICSALSTVFCTPEFQSRNKYMAIPKS